MGISTAMVARDLGVDIALGAGRRIPAQKARFKKAACRAGRLARIKGPVRRKACLSVSFLQTTALYGEEVMGLSEASMRSLRAAAARAIYGKRQGQRCVTAALALTGRSNADPSEASAGRLV